MKLTTIMTPSGCRAVRIDADGYTELGSPDLGQLLARQDWREHAAAHQGAVHDQQSVQLLPVIPNPGKVVCVGLNYRSHILEMGRELPEYPTLFAKFTDALIGPADDIALPAESDAVDWEAELAVIVGSTVRRADDRSAADAIAGFTVMNDISMREWQFRTREWLQGKTFEASTPIGPVLVTPDELPGGTAPRLVISASLNGEIVQKADTSDLVFTPVDLVRYVSTITTLRPGDLIATGTPGGVGHARKPPRYLHDGDVVVTEVEHIGRLTNRTRAA
jgi:acylpyruvate hydrolase